MEKEVFETFVHQVIPCALFHVSKTDIDSKSGGRLDETILLNMLTSHPDLLAHKPLSWFVNHFILETE